VKKVLSVVLSLVMLLSITTGMTMTAQATSITQAQAVNWANSQIGRSLDYDGAYGAQCVDLTKYYYAYLGVSPVNGNGCDYATNVLPNGWQRIPYSSGFAAQPGDIAVWTYSTSAYGHVAIVTGASTSSMNVVEQNASTGTRAHSYSYSYGTFFGVIRPDFTSVNTPEPIISDNKNYVSVGENIAFWYSGLTECSKVEFYFEKDGKVYYTKDSTSSREFVTYFENEGLYNIYVGGYYNGQWYYSSKITVYVFNPKLTSNKTSVDINEEITLTYSGLTVSQKVEICFEKDGKTYYTDDSTTSRTYKNYFEKPGEYYVYAKGTINNYSTISNKVKITVTCNHNYNKSVTKDATCKTAGVLTYTCTKCGDSYTETIAKKSHTVVKDDAVLETCTSNGLTEGSHCSVCGEIITAQKTISAIGHKSDNGTVTKTPTYTETGTKEYKCTVCGKVLKIETLAKLAKKANTLKASGKTKNVKYSTLKKKNVTVVRKDIITVSKAQGKINYMKISGNKKITVSSSGKITVKKGLKKGTYKVKVKVTAAGNSTYKSGSKTVKVTIKVK